MAINKARKRRLATHVAQITGKAIVAEKPDAKAAPKSEIARARAIYESAYAALTDSERATLARWEIEGPPRIARTETSDIAKEIPKISTSNVVAGERQDHLPEWTGGPRVASMLVFDAVDYTAFDDDPTNNRRAFVQTAWDARAFYFALETDKELYKLYWPSRGGCRADGMDALRDEIAGIRGVKAADRTVDQIDYLSKLERALLLAEHAHEEPLRAARDLAVRQGRSADEAYNAETVCPHCAGTSVLRPSFDAPMSLVREWLETANGNANRRFFRLEALRRGKLNHDLDLTRENAMGHTVDESWEDFRKRVMRPISRGKPQGPTVKLEVHDQGAKWLARA